MPPQEREPAFADLIARHKGIVFKVCHLYCRSQADKEDLAQEILVQLWRSFASFDGRHAFSTWMYRVALNTAISWSRHDSLRKRHITAADENAIVNMPGRDAISEELGSLYHLIDGLDPAQKAMMLLYLDGNSHEEIADVLGITPSNVATRMNRLKNRWREQFATNQHV